MAFCVTERMPYDEATALRALLNSTPDLISFFDSEGRYRFVGEVVARAIGLPASSMVGKTAAEIGLSATVVERFERHRQEVMSSGRSIRHESTFETPDGPRIFESVIAPVASEGTTLGVVIVTRDVTDTRHAAEALRVSEAKFATAFDRSPLALTITSLEDGRLVDVNDSFTRVSGFAVDEAIGRTPEELGLWIDPERRAERFLHMRERDEVPEIETRFRMKDGTERVGVVGSAVVEIAGRPCVLSAVMDITDRKHAEQAKDEFLATLSHELRTPLTSAYGWVKLLGKSREPDLLETGLRAIEESVLTQIRLIDDLLDVSRIVAGTTNVDLHPVDLGDAVDAAVEMVRAVAEAKRLSLNVHVQSVLTVCGDAGRLQQVFWNLLSNSVKFTPAGGSIDVILQPRGDDAQVLVRDTGEGIEPAFLPHVFDRFRQADSSISRRHGGLGLGLAIVRSLVEAHEGTVTAESEGPGRGATFTVTIPRLDRGNPLLQSLPDAAAEVVSLAGIRVVIVDDDAPTRHLVATTLESVGAEVRQCEDSAQGFEVLAIWQPHVLISDLAMPGEDGYSLIRRIRANGNQLPAIAITAYARAEDATRVREAGFQRHLPKPFDPRTLVLTVRELV